jgi:hypothetical protein
MSIKYNLHDKKAQVIDLLDASDIYMVSHISKVAFPSLFREFVKEIVMQKKYDDEEGVTRVLR